MIQYKYFIDFKDSSFPQLFEKYSNDSHAHSSIIEYMGNRLELVSDEHFVGTIRDFCIQYKTSVKVERIPQDLDYDAAVNENKNVIININI